MKYLHFMHPFAPKTVSIYYAGILYTETYDKKGILKMEEWCASLGYVASIKLLHKVEFIHTTFYRC